MTPELVVDLAKHVTRLNELSGFLGAIPVQRAPGLPVVGNQRASRVTQEAPRRAIPKPGRLKVFYLLPNMRLLPNLAWYLTAKDRDEEWSAAEQGVALRGSTPTWDGVRYRGLASLLPAEAYSVLSFRPEVLPASATFPCLLLSRVRHIDRSAKGPHWADWDWYVLLREVEEGGRTAVIALGPFDGLEEAVDQLPVGWEKVQKNRVAVAEAMARLRKGGR